MSYISLLISNMFALRFFEGSSLYRYTRQMAGNKRQCHVNMKQSRNKCRACRLRNCLEGGMNTKQVRDERSKQERRTPPDNSDPKTNKKSSHSVIREECQLTHFVCGLERQTELLSDDYVMGGDAGKWSRDVSLTSGLQNPRLFIKRSPVNWQCERIMQSADVYSSWYRAFVLHADWAMGIPDFRAIPLEDQTTLFKQNFMCFGWITHAYNAYILGHHEMGIPLGTGAYIPYPHEEQQQMEPKWASAYGIVCKKLIDLIVKPMRKMQMTNEENCILKTISLFQQDCTLSATAQSICTRFTERLLEALLVHYERQFPSMSYTQRTIRALKLTLLLPSFNHIGQVESTMIQSMSAVDLNELSGVPIKIMNTHSSANIVLAIPTETLAACQ